METCCQETELIQNLEGAGCSPETISAFMAEIGKGDAGAGLKLLAAHRRLLLEGLHQKQKQIDCLDYLTDQIKRRTGPERGKDGWIKSL